jgi:protein tyrosine phosphatase
MSSGIEAEYNELRKLYKVEGNVSRLLDDQTNYGHLNRFEDIYPYTDTRVELKARAEKSELADLYLNACYMDSPLLYNDRKIV